MYRINLNEDEDRNKITQLMNHFFDEYSRGQGHKKINGQKKPSINIFPMKNGTHEDKLNFSYMNHFEVIKNNKNLQASYSANVIQDNKIFEKSRIFGLKSPLIECPDILLSKDAFKQKYESSYIPVPNYDVSIYARPLFVKTKEYAPAFINIFNELIPAIVEVFSKYGTIERMETYSNYENYSRSYSIKNNLEFELNITTQTKYRIYNNQLVPDYTINLELMPIKNTLIESVNAMNFATINLSRPKKIHLKFNVSYFAFLNKPNYYLQCLTPHGYIRLKKDYLNDFLKQVTFHYLFKKYFGQSNIDVSLADLDDDPMSYFSLVEMMDI